MKNGPELPQRVVTLEVNGARRSAACADRTLLVEFLREGLGLNGTHVGCLNGDCGACTVRLDGQIVKSCLMLAASADGGVVTTVEGLADGDTLHPLQEAFWERDGFQCGFCLPGQLFASLDLLESEPDPDDEQIRAALGGNLCRCTGYEKIVESVRTGAQRMTQQTADRGEA
jgi:carbon-monoxide dehydrogenase small subunit